MTRPSAAGDAGTAPVALLIVALLVLAMLEGVLVAGLRSEAERFREGVADAIVGGPESLRETLGADRRGPLPSSPARGAQQRSPRTWRHRRLTLPSRATQRRLERDGWFVVGTWFPFRYFKRDTAPADG